MGKGDQTRGTILDAALDVASTVGLEALSIGRLAERVGLSKSGLFAHFRSKEALQLEVLEHARADFIQGVVAPALGAPRGLPRLRALFDNWLAWGRGARTSVLGGWGAAVTAARLSLSSKPGWRPPISSR